MGIRKSRRLRNFLMIFLFVMSLFIGIGSAEDVSLYGEMTLSSHTNPEQTPIMTFSIGAGSDTEANLYVRDLNGNLVAVSSMMVLNSDILTPIIEGGGEGEIENSLFPDSFWGYYVVTGDTVMIDGTIDISAYINDFANPLPDSLTNTYDVTLWRADESDGVETTTSACVVIDVSGPTIDLVDDGSGLEEAPYVMLNISDLDGIVDPDGDGDIEINGVSYSYNKSTTCAFQYDVVLTGEMPDFAETNRHDVVPFGENVTLHLDDMGLETGTSYDLYYRAIDDAGNVSELYSITFTLSNHFDVTPTVDDLTNDLILEGVYAINQQASGVSYRFSVDQSDSNLWADSWISSSESNMTLDISGFSPLANGTHTLYMEFKGTVDGSEIISSVVSSEFFYDTEAPTAVIVYSTTLPTYDPVTATLDLIQDNYSGSDQIVVNQVEYILTSSEDTFDFILTDEAGNECVLTAEAPWISAEARPLDVHYSEVAKTKLPVVVYFTPRDDAFELNDLSLVTEVSEALYDVETIGGIDYYTFYENGVYQFMYTDDRGKTGYKNAVIGNIDTEAPTATVEYNISEPTNSDVTAVIKVSERATYTYFDTNNQIVESGQIFENDVLYYTFNANAALRLVLEDSAGNTNEYAVEVSWIDKVMPNVVVEYSDNYYAPSNGEVIYVQLSADEPIYVLNNGGATSKAFYENGDFTFYVSDVAGNRTSVAVSMTNFLEGPPVGTYVVAPSYLTNQNVEVTATYDRAVTVLNNGGSNTMIFEENGDKYFQLQTVNGDIYYDFVTVSNIDKTAPTMSFDGAQDLVTVVGTAIDVESGIHISDDRDGVIDNYLLGTFVNWNVPGDYTLIYNYQDSAGNQASTSRLIRVLAPDEVALRINGRLYSDQTLAFDPGELEVETFNTKGNYEIQIKNYTVKKGQFKSRQDFLNETFIQGISGYYTVLLQDQERSWDMVIFKINE